MRWIVVLVLVFCTAVSQADFNAYTPIEEIKVDPKKSVLTLNIIMGEKSYRFALDMEYSDIYVVRAVVKDALEYQTGLIKTYPGSPTPIYVPDLKFGGYHLEKDYRIFSMSDDMLKKYPADQFDGVLGSLFIANYIWRFTANSVAVYEKKYSDSRDYGSFVPVFRETAHYQAEEESNVEITRVVIPACLSGISDPLRIYPSFTLKNQWSAVIGDNDKWLEEKFASESPTLSLSALQPSCGSKDNGLYQAYPLCQKVPYPDSPPYEWMQEDKVNLFAENISVIHKPKNELLVGCPSLSVSLPQLAKNYGAIVLHGLSYLHFESYSTGGRLQPY
ncbi:MAG: hypothetical protein ACR2PX_07460 [Endozoicomonas sp.]|uniref:hypothetical protein n=1 Tax=Endozoicomonas sp. TaxID=1892382 RepID=UPI003D9B5704